LKIPELKWWDESLSEHYEIEAKLGEGKGKFYVNSLRACRTLELLSRRRSQCVDLQTG